MPAASVVLEMASGEVVTGAAATVMETAAVCFWVGWLLSLTLTVKANVPLTVGAPEITPLAAARVRPAGRVPDATAHV